MRDGGYNRIMAYTKETKKQLRERLKSLYRPYPVALNERGDPSLGELMSRLHANILANRELDPLSEKYRKVLLEGASPIAVECDDNGVPTKFLAHKEVLKSVRRVGYVRSEETGKWHKR